MELTTRFYKIYEYIENEIKTQKSKLRLINITFFSFLSKKKNKF